MTATGRRFYDAGAASCARPGAPSPRTRRADSSPSTEGAQIVTQARDDVFVTGGLKDTAKYEGMAGTTVFKVPEAHYTWEGMNQRAIQDTINRRALFYDASRFGRYGRMTALERRMRFVQGYNRTIMGISLPPPNQ